MFIPAYINGSLYYFQREISILEACRSVGITIPRFCFHENLSIAGNCRMCLVEVQEIAKPIVSCSTDVLENMIIYTDSPTILKARENVLEFLLLNHPLDCPICDQAGECDLQDQAIFFGSSFGRNYFYKRAVEEKILNHLIKTIMVRCIHCTKCVRFGEEICGVKFFGTLGRGTTTEIGNYLTSISLSEISANVIDLCPVGALTLKTVPYQLRPWEIQYLESIDLSDSFGSNIYLAYRGTDLFRVVPKKNKYINESWITNKCRFYYELLIKTSTPVRQFEESSFFKTQNRLLFLLNPDLDLKSLSLLKALSRKKNNISVKLLNSTTIKTNLSFWNHKLRLKCLAKNVIYTFFLISTNPQVETPLLNIRLRAKCKQNSEIVLSSPSLTLSNKILCFSVEDVIKILQGVQPYFSKLFFQTYCVFFTTKSIQTQLDSFFFKVLEKKKIKHYSISLFCNSEGANFLNIRPKNLKEFFFTKFVFGLCLDDTFLLRKFLLFFSTFFWVNQFPASLLGFLPFGSWINLEINQLPGLYVNFEQRVQKFSLLAHTYKISILKFLQKFSTTFLTAFKIPKLSFPFLKKFWYENELYESCTYLSLFDSKKLFFVNNFFINNSFYFVIKMSPLKLILEDPYRTSLQLKFSRTLIKSSQLLRTETSFNNAFKK